VAAAVDKVTVVVVKVTVAAVDKAIVDTTRRTQSDWPLECGSLNKAH
jgi:hypothetical protein